MDLLSKAHARRRFLRRLACQAGALAALPALAQGEQRPKREDALALVTRAVAFYKQQGRAEAFVEFNKRSGRFSAPGMYIFVYDMNGVCLAVGNNPRLIGKNLRQLRDANGNYMIRNMLDIAARDGKGWNEYVWINPTTGQPEEKLSYFEKIDAVVIGAGVYK